MGDAENDSRRRHGTCRVVADGGDRARTRNTHQLPRTSKSSGAAPTCRHPARPPRRGVGHRRALVPGRAVRRGRSGVNVDGGYGDCEEGECAYALRRSSDRQQLRFPPFAPVREPGANA
jgi:hypothetical protein